MSEVTKQQSMQDWQTVLLEEISRDVSYGYTASSTDEELGPRMLRITDIQDNAVDWSAVPYCEIDEQNIGKYLLAENDIVFARTGATVGKSFLIPNNVKNSIFASYLIRVRLIGSVHPKYISYFFQSGNYWLQIKDNSSGIGQPNVNGSKLKKLLIPLAPLNQQKQIVAKIEELFSHIDAGIEGLKKTKALLKQYRQSVLNAAVTGNLFSEPFSKECFNSIEYGLQSLGQGWSPRCENESSNDEETWCVIKTTAVQSLEFREEENKRLPANLEPRFQHEILIDDLLITRAGPRVRVGVCCLVKKTRKKLMICDKVYRLRVKKEVILPEYLEIVLNAPNVQREIEKLKSGINDSGVNLTQNKFTQLQIPYPSLKQQKQIIKILNEKITSVVRLEAEIEKQILKAEKNKQSILAAAFSGKLLND